eukprot:4015794-Pyramimonas_sp.AAC.1
MLEQGINDAVRRFSDHGNPWAGIQGPFTACAATAIRLGLQVDGFVFAHSVLGRISVRDVGPRTF